MTRDDLIARASAIKGDETECWISDPWVAIVPLLSLKIHAKPALFDVASQDASVVQIDVKKMHFPLLTFDHLNS